MSSPVPAPRSGPPDGGTTSLRRPGSWVLHRVDRITSRPLIAIGVVLLDGAWLLFSVIWDFPGRLETIFQTLVAALTLAMVFVIQHTQAKLNIATQRKLDEILLALPAADNGLVSLEQGTDQELQIATEAHQLLREPVPGPRDR